jgi:hypothetical protein
MLSGTSIKAQVLLNEGFEGTTFPPTNWSVQGVSYGATTPWTRSTTTTAGANCTGTSSGVAYSQWSPSGSPSGTQAWLITPSITVPASATVTLTFCDRESFTSTEDPASTFTVRVSTTTNALASFTNTVFTRNEVNVTTYNQRTVDLSAYAGQTIYLAFVHQNSFGDGWRVDNVNVTAVVNPPEINLLGTDNSTITSGTTTTATANGTDFGAVSVASGTTVSRTFTLQNTGVGNLTPGTVTSSNANFSITQQPGATVSPAGSTTFTVRFNPSSFGSFTSTISIPNNDSDENPYTFRVSGSATAPEINVVGLGTNIANNKFLTTSTDGTFLGVVTGSATSLSSSFTVQNTGTENLTISGITMRRGSSSAFSVANVPTSILPAGSADFTISYDASKGSQMDTVAIASNDGDEAVYLFTVSAGGVVAALDNNLADGTLLISPNPSSKNFNIKIGGAKYTSVNAIVYDMAGRAVKTQNITQFAGSMDLDLGNLEKGTYILMLETGGEKVARKLIKQ